MKRKAIKELENWLNSKRRKPLIVWGARQVGKTYLLLELFAKEKFKNSYVYVDFKKDDDICSYCEETADAEKIIQFLSLRFGKIIDESTLLIFDEAQECPNIISALKYFNQCYPEIPVVATGSMVRLKLQRESKKRGSGGKEQFLFPVGKINQLTLYPMTFDEFLLSSNSLLYETVANAYEKRTPLASEIHELALDEFYKFLLVGGMPEAVQAYVEGEGLTSVRTILKDLYDNYLADMELYQASPEAIFRSRAVFKNIFTQLNKESKNFSPGLIERNKKVRDFASATEWLCTAKIVQQSFQLKEHVTTPFIPEQSSHFRLYLCDVGMFSYQSNVAPETFISSERNNTLSGIFFENFVANELAASGQDLFYWRGKNDCEFEFVAQSQNKLYPIDVKKGKGALNSLSKFSEHNKFECAIKISRNNFGFAPDQKIMTVPFYFTPFIAADLATDCLDCPKKR